MPIDTSSYCKQCGKIQVDGVVGNWWRLKPDYAVVCTCVRNAFLKLVDGNDKEITSNHSLMCEKALKAGTPISEGYSWHPAEDKSFVSHAIKLSLKKKIELEGTCPPHEWYVNLTGNGPHGCKKCGWNPNHKAHRDEEAPAMRTESERNNGREIERKYRVMEGLSLNFLNQYVMNCIGYTPMPSIFGTSVDIFWSQPGVDFVRLRENTLELTVKITDKLTTEDRVEKNLKIDSFEKGLQWATTVFGEPKGANRTTFYVYYLPTAEVTIYEVKDYDQVFLEIEAGSIEEVIRIESELRKTITLKQELKSLYQILFGGN